LILDPFCGCGTTVQVAQRLNRLWIGIDITHLAIGLIKKRLSDAFGPEIRSTYDVIGEPTDYAGAEERRGSRHRRPSLLPRRHLRPLQADHLLGQGRRRLRAPDS
jgi:hypothetical protein